MFQLKPGFCQNALFVLLSQGVFRFQFSGQRLNAGAIRAGEQFQSSGSVADASAGIDPRSKLEGDVACAYGAVLKSGRLNQRRDARAGEGVHLFKSQTNQYTVFVLKGNHICHGSQRSQIKVLLGCFKSAEGTDEFEGRAGSAQKRERIIAQHRICLLYTSRCGGRWKTCKKTKRIGRLALSHGQYAREKRAACLV